MLNYQKKCISLLLCFAFGTLFAMDHRTIDVPRCIKNAQEDQFNKFIMQEWSTPNTDLDVRFSKIHSAAKLTDDAIKLRNKRLIVYACGAGISVCTLVGSCLLLPPFEKNHNLTTVEYACVAGARGSLIALVGSGAMFGYEFTKLELLQRMKENLMSLPIFDRFKAKPQYLLPKVTPKI